MGHGNGELGHPPFHGRCARINGLHPVVQVIDLSAPLNLPPDGVVQNPLVMLQDEGLHRIPVRRRRFNGRHVPNARQGHVQGPGNRGGREGQNIHTFRDLLQPLLVRDAEALLLIHHQKTQILKLHAFLQKLVGPNDHVQRSGPQILQGLFLLGRGAEPAEHVHIHRKSPEAAHHRLVMLLRQHRGGHQNGNLLAVQHRLHDRPQRHLRFAEAHISA